MRTTEDDKALITNPDSWPDIVLHMKEIPSRVNAESGRRFGFLLYDQITRVYLKPNTMGVEIDMSDFVDYESVDALLEEWWID